MTYRCCCNYYCIVADHELVGAIDPLWEGIDCTQLHVMYDDATTAATAVTETLERVVASSNPGSRTFFHLIAQARP